MSMRIHITFDYELFFGSKSGTAHKCLLEPTNRLIQLAETLNVQFTFFVDAGYLYQLQQHNYDAACKETYTLVSAQLKNLLAKGHEIGLHIHPHWEDSYFKNGHWHINTKRYKLSDFTKTEVHSIFERYHKSLIEACGKPCQSYRAGGWCIQPFSNIQEALVAQHIFTDSSVYKNGYHQFTAQAYDFRNAPNKTQWTFENDECIEVENGRFTELAITPHSLSPLFYWQLYLRMKINPAYYVPIGDGSWLKDKRKIYKQFYSSTQHFASCDGYFASQLTTIYKKLKAETKNTMVILGHPKSLAPCSFDSLEKFITSIKKEGNECVTLT
jgi:peptidoglycan/xylan/chitin deacetylase (PgdA/CDA1 family)